MKDLRFSVDIDAPALHVWDVMLGLDTYREWTRSFAEGSTYRGGWGTGDEIRFVGENDATESGLFGVIEDSRPGEFVSVRYLGDIQNGVEVRDAAIAGAHENYSFTETDGVTTLVVDLEVPDEWAEMMSDMWASAILSIKELAERP